MTVVRVLASLDSLLLLGLPLPRRGAAATGAAGCATFLPLAVAVVALVAVVVRVVLAFSTMFVKMVIAAAPVAGAAGLCGDTGRARYDFVGEGGRTGGRVTVWGLAERGERTWSC
jgi:hypothetical protein